MQNTNLEEIKQVCLTLAHGCISAQSQIQNGLKDVQYIGKMLEDIAMRIGILEMELRTPVQTKPDPSDRDLILEWISDNGYDYNDDFEGVVSTELNVNHYSDNCEIGIDKEVTDYERDNLLESIITRYLEWAAQQTIETQEEGEGDA